jgi:hypothetical protein
MAADRAINMALRVLGIGEVERDFKRVGDAGDKSFAEVKKAANGAALEVSDYTARLKRAADLAKQMAANTPALSKGSPEQIKTNRRDFILGAVRGEQERILQGLPDTTKLFQEGSVAAEGFGGALGLISAAAAGTTLVLGGLTLATKVSLEAFAEHEKAVSVFNATISLAGNRSLAGAGEIREMGRQIAASSGQTETSVLQAGAALAKIPGLSREGLQAALEASTKLADALGTDVASVVNDTVAPAFQALAKRDMKAFYDATKDLDPQLVQLVINLEEAGKAADAQRVFLAGLSGAAGDSDASGLTGATNRLAGAWRRLKEDMGEDISGPAAFGINKVAGLLEWLRGKMAQTGASWSQMLNNLGTSIGSGNVVLGTLLRGAGPLFGSKQKTPAADPDPYGTGAMMNAAAEAVADARLKARFADKPKAGGRSGGRRSAGGRSAADAARREADQARAAADRIEQSNADVVKSWQQRTDDVEATVGLEGDALKQVQDQQEVEAAVRRINTDAIAKEVDARRKAAAAAHQQFDEAAATKAATAAVQDQQASVRDLAERYAAATRAQAEFNQRQQEAKSIIEGLKNPLEKLNDEIETAIKDLRAHALTTDQFDERMKQIARSIAEANLEADKGKQIWKGFGEDVGRTLSDFILRGGSAREVLQRLIQLPLERLLYKNIEQPIAKAIDSLLGVDLDKNAAKIHAGMISGKQVSGASVELGDAAAPAMTGLTTATAGATQALDVFAGRLGAVGPGSGYDGSPTNLLTGTPFANDNVNPANDVAQPLDEVGTSATAAGQAMQQLVPLTGQFGGALTQVIASLSAGAGGGGGGFLGSVLGIAAGAFGGGISAGTVARLAPSAGATIAANPGLFASGTDDLPIGRPFWVGENGREQMERTSSGKIRVLSHQQAHREVGNGGGITVVNHISVDKFTDPRRTASSVARGTQGGIARAARKGLAMGPG